MYSSGSGRPLTLAKWLPVRPSFVRLLVHQLDEGGLAAGQPLGEHDAGVVAGLDDHAAQ